MSAPIKDRHKSPKMSVRFPNSRAHEYLDFIEEYRKSHDLANQNQAVVTIFDDVMMHGLQPKEETLNLQKCEYLSLIPAHLEYVNCKKNGWSRTMKGEECRACAQYEIKRIPLQAIAKLEANIEKLKQEKNDLKVEIENLRIEAQKCDQNTVSGLQRLLRDRQEKLNYALETIGKTREMNEPQFIERVVEEKTTEKKTTEKRVSQEPKTPSQLILCPVTNDHVSIEDKCEKDCRETAECHYYRQIVQIHRT
jgi:hypothetical protein